VTGATGFIGGEIARVLSAAGWDVLASGRREAGEFPRYQRADLSDAFAARSVVRDVDAVVHAAGLAHRAASTSSMMENNALSTENVARAAASTARVFVLLSSISVYGHSEPGVKTEDGPCRPETPYATSKLEAERRAFEAGATSKMRVRILRLSTVFGEGDPGNCGRLMRSIGNGRFRWIGRGLNLKSLVYKGDVAQACIRALEADSAEIGVYNVSAEPVSMAAIVGAYAGALGKDLPRRRIPAGLAVAASGAAASLCLFRGPAARAFSAVRTWLRSDVVDTEKAARELGFRASTSLTEGIRRQVQHYLGSDAENVS
jgi:nucleoside-diphosphate-sugar epimerase